MVNSSQPQSGSKSDPFVNNSTTSNKKGTDVRTRLNDCIQVLWCGNLCLCCVNNCFALVKNLAECF